MEKFEIDGKIVSEKDYNTALEKLGVNINIGDPVPRIQENSKSK